MTELGIVLVAVLGYLIGGFPPHISYLAGRLRGVDIRKVSSGNVGATNALDKLLPQTKA
jgi:glycerol-3-phosphate acyltransferase PlsY